MKSGMLTIRVVEKVRKKVEVVETDLRDWENVSIA